MGEKKPERSLKSESLADLNIHTCKHTLLRKKMHSYKVTQRQHILPYQLIHKFTSGRIYICGGFNGQECLNSVEYYEPSSQWTLIT